ncbi:MAG TPA: M24 family metallopeptidase [Bellilinea sp.]|nr:M24 family metallopeptidase [Bellilinea sp.]
MKSDLDQLMKQNNIDAIFVTGSAMYNPTMVYLTGGGHVSDALLFKKKGETPLMFVNMMERDEAAKSGFNIRLTNEFPMKELLAETGNDWEKVGGLQLTKAFKAAGVESGRVAIYGEREIGGFFNNLEAVRKNLPNLEFVGYAFDPIFNIAMMTKDEAEIERMKKIGAATSQVVSRVWNLISDSNARDGKIYLDDGQPLTIGYVKRKIDLWLAEQGASNPHSVIFAQGRDAGIPHSSGDDEATLELGKTIVFDIYPCETGGGYFHDMTRTWSPGYATEETQRLYDEVKLTYDTLISKLSLNMPFKDVQALTCELFEEMGHATIRQDPAIQEGYIHSIGHGVGLKVHERPTSGMAATETDILAPYSVFTIEPGLYYPSKGMGARIEDSYVTKPDGSFEKLGNFHYDFVIPVKGYNK